MSILLKPIIEEIHKEEEVKNICGIGDPTLIAGVKERKKNNKRKGPRTGK